jgi:transposase
VLWRKDSFGTQSEAGSRFVESMMTVVATLKQQQRNVFAYLTAACEAALRGETAPSLLPASAQKVPTSFAQKVFLEDAFCVQNGTF